MKWLSSSETSASEWQGIYRSACKFCKLCWSVLFTSDPLLTKDPLGDGRGAVLRRWKEKTIKIAAAAAAAAKSLQSCPHSVRPHRWQPARLPRPWDSPGKNTGVVAISFSNARKCKVKVKSLSVSDSLQPHGLQPTRLLHPWDFPGKSTGVGCHHLLRFNWEAHVEKR